MDGQSINVPVAGSFNDPDGDVLTYSATGLPAGLSVDPVTGAISGTLDVEASRGGPYAIDVSADDGEGGVVTSRFILNVLPDAYPLPPTDSGYDGGDPSGGPDADRPYNEPQAGQPIISETVAGMADLDTSDIFAAGGDHFIQQLVEWIGLQSEPGWMQGLRDYHGYDIYAGQQLDLSVSFGAGDGLSDTVTVSTMVLEDNILLELSVANGNNQFLNSIEVSGVDGQVLDWLVRIDSASLVMNVPVGTEWIDLRLASMGDAGMVEFWDVRINTTSGEILVMQHGGGDSASLPFSDELQKFAMAREIKFDSLINALNG